jgi:ComF family protein
MKFREFLDKAFFYLSVPKCVCCKERLSIKETALSDACLSVAEESIARECPVCLKPTPSCLCQNKYLESHFLKGHIKLYKYGAGDNSKPLDSLVYAIKRGERKDLFDFLATRLADAVRSHGISLVNACITNVPRRRSAILRFGLDHAKVLAERVAERLGIEYMPLLKSTAKRAQKLLSGEERIENTSFSIIRDADLNGRTVIIVDDLVTTGTSMGSAATLIRSMGA